MELSSGSSSSIRFGGRKVCECGLPAKIFKSKTVKNPHRRFFGCQLYKEGGNEHCKYFRWYDEEEVQGRALAEAQGRALAEAQADIFEKNKIIDQLTATIMELRGDLERHQVERSLIDIDEEKNSIEIDVQKKIDDMETIVYRQHIIIIGLVVCALWLRSHCLWLS